MESTGDFLFFFCKPSRMAHDYRGIETGSDVIGRGLQPGDSSVGGRLSCRCLGGCNVATRPYLPVLVAAGAHIDLRMESAVDTVPTVEMTIRGEPLTDLNWHRRGLAVAYEMRFPNARVR